MKQSLSGLSAFFKTTEVYVTGGTYTAGTALENNTGGTFNVTGFSTGTTDTVTQVELIQLEQLCLENNTGGTFNVTGFKYRYN
jgi:predicted Rdx family selenoprotein